MVCRLVSISCDKTILLKIVCLLISMSLWASTEPRKKPAETKAVKPDAKNANTDTSLVINETEIMAEALNFFETEGNELAVENISNQIIQNYSSNTILVRKLLEFVIGRKNREAVYRTWKELASSSQCHDSFESKEPCIFLKSVWFETIDNLIFYEDTAPKLEATRRALSERDCALAQSILDQIKNKEGAFPSLLRLQISAANCQKDKPSAIKISKELKILMPKGLE